MIKVAICDGDAAAGKKLHDCLARMPGIGACDVFSDRQEWKTWQQEEDYQAVFMDCGWEAGKEERLTGTKVIYLSAEPEKYIQQLFFKKEPPFGFLIKPVQEDMLARYVGKLTGEAWEPEGSLLIRTRGSVRTVPWEEILFLESAGHVVEVWTREESFRCYGKLDQFLSRLPEFFVQCHKSYLVNLKAVHSIERNWILMDQGRLVPVSKSRRRETKEAFVRYRGGEDREQERKTE